jgi:hypothetical protein
MALPLDLQDDEVVRLVCRRHIVFLATRLAWRIAALLVPLVLLALIARGVGFSGIVVTGSWIVAAVWSAYWLVAIYFTWYRHQHDLWIITNQRLVDSLRRHWFHHQMSSADLVDVEDMSIVKEGLFATVFGYGDLNCQTAGAQSRFILSGIPHPDEVLTLVDASRDAARRELRGLDQLD